MQLEVPDFWYAPGGQAQLPYWHTHDIVSPVLVVYGGHVWQVEMGTMYRKPAPVFNPAENVLGGAPKRVVFHVVYCVAALAPAKFLAS